jgi:hypothetical protein
MLYILKTHIELVREKLERPNPSLGAPPIPPERNPQG